MTKMRAPGRARRFGSRRDRGDAFLPDPAGGVFIASSDAASCVIAAATSADFVLEDARNELSIDEIGGPFMTDDDEVGLYE